MTLDRDKKTLQERFQHLFAVISGQRFLQKQGLGNEVPFFICPFKSEQSVEMARLQGQLVKRLEQAGVRVLDINLYDLAIELLKDRGIWEQILEMEDAVSKDELKELLQGVLDPEAHLVPAIAAKLAANAFDVLFLAGVGEVFPYIRSHHVLNNLQSTAKDKPTVLFFPGAYTHSLASGASLDLFGRLHDDKYYRVLPGVQYLSLRRVNEGNVMTLKTIFQKPVDRPIEGVIKADGVVSDQRPIFKNLKSIPVLFDKAWLADEADVDRYLESLREALLAEISKGKRIQI